jgi:hypothetical protein
VLAVVTLCVTLLVGCTGSGGGDPFETPQNASKHPVLPGTPQLVSATVPHVRGLQASRALRLMHHAGFGTVQFSAVPSVRTVGVVLAQRPKAGAAARVVRQIEITISAGSTEVGALLGVPGIGTCEMRLRPSRKPCVGGPVLVPVRVPPH